MTDERWLRDALREATARQPVVADRVERAFARARRRQQQRAVAVSCVAVLAVLATAVVTRGTTDAEGLRPVSPTASPSGQPYESPEPSPSPAGGPVEESPSPAAAAGEERPDAEPEPAASRREKLDVYVLLDATTSMTESHDQVARWLGTIDARLRDHGVDLAWGLGVFRDFHPQGIYSGPVYQRIRDIGTGGTISADGVGYGGGMPPEEEWATMALDGVAGIGHAPYTDSDQAAHWRPGARRVVLLVTDASMAQGSGVPTIEEAVETMNDNGIRVAGLHVVAVNPPEPAGEHMRRVARGTGALASRAIDCDGYPGAEIQPGDPLVCDVMSADTDDVTGLADALIRLP